MQLVRKLRELRRTVLKVRVTGRITGKSLQKVEHDLAKRHWDEPLALAVIVNSPGGSATQSSLIGQALRAHADTLKIPFLAFAEDMAASGGYHVMLQADSLYVNSSSLLGSIGAMFSFLGAQQLADHYGIERRSWSTPQESFEMKLDPLRPFSAEKREWANKLVQNTAALFQQKVLTHRQGKLDETRLVEIFSGDVFSGEQALQLGLVDAIGTLDSVISTRFPGAQVIDLSSQSPLQRLLDLI